MQERLPSLEELKQQCSEQLAAMRGDHVRSLNPTPYKVRYCPCRPLVSVTMRGGNERSQKRISFPPPLSQVSVSDQLYKYIHELWLKEAPVGELN